MADCSKYIGFAFDNPDVTSNYHAPKWGLLVTADELRYDQMFGNPLVAESDNQAFTDEQLLDYVRLAIAYLERELNIDILPRLVRYQNQIGADGKEIARTDIDDKAYIKSLKSRKQLANLYIRESGYSYNVIRARRELRVKLRRRPVREILTAVMTDPYRGSAVLDLMPYRFVKSGFTGVCYFRPNGISGQFLGGSNYAVDFYHRNYQNIFLIDYTTGYDNAANVPDDLRNIISKIAACTLMNTYGDGKFAAIASRSVSLNSVSESIGTTMSATSAAFGARILQYQKEIREWLANNKAKYSRTSVGVL